MRTQTVVVLLSVICLAVAPLVVPAEAQQTQKRSEIELLPVAPLAELPSRSWDIYDVSVSLEMGGQIANIHGNNEVYRSHLNYSDGFRVFSFNVRGKGQDNAFLSDFYFMGAGWGGDPQNWARFGLGKDKWFDFRGHYRRNDYFWVFPGFARDQHRNDQERRLQSYDLTLLPNRPLRFHLGYTRNSSFGLAFVTQDFSRDEFLVFEPIRQTYDQYRGGVEWTYQSWNFFFEQSYRFFRNERVQFLSESFNPGNDPGDAAFLTDLDRDTPTRGRIPFTRFTLTGRPHRTVDVTARIIYSDIDIDATRFETTVGRLFTGTDAREIFTTAIDADRSYTVADWAVTWRPLRNLTISNHLRFDQYNISGVGTFGEFESFPVLGTTSQAAEILQHQLLFEGYRNRLEGRYDFNRWLSVRGGFTYDHRDVELTEFEFECATPAAFSLTPSCPSIVDIEEESERTDLNNRSFLMGVIVRPRRNASVFFDLERGNATGVFTRLSPNNINRIRLRGRWEPVDGVKLSSSWFLFDNENNNLPTSATNAFGITTILNTEGRHTSRNRGFSIDLQLTRFERGYLNLGYSRNDVTALTDVAFFFGAPFPGAPDGGVSTYIANDNYAYIDFGGHITGNLYGDAGYRVVFTTGTFPASDPVQTCNPFVPGSCDNTGGLEPLGINPGGLNFHQPHAALRYVFSDTVSWKAGWRWYGYNVKGGAFSDYKAHVVTTSMVLTF